METLSATIFVKKIPILSPLLNIIHTGMDENQQQSKVNKSADELVSSIVIYLYLVNPWADRAKLHDDVGLFRNARITSDRSEILTVACKHSKPITWRVLAPNYQT